MELQGKTALVTGSCGNGSGVSTALRLARERANIVLNYGTARSGLEMEKRGQKIAREIEKFGGRAIVFKADTRDENQVREMVKAAEKEFGGVDILINNAGGEWYMGDITNTNMDQWRETLSAEIDGAMLTMKYALQGMRKRRWGRIIHMGLDGVFRHANFMAPAYCLGKAARSWMTEALGPIDFRNGITMNCIELQETDRLDLKDAVRLAKGDHLDAKISAVGAEKGQKKWQGKWRDRPNPICHDIAEIVAFLCSDAGRFISGNQIRLPHW